MAKNIIYKLLISVLLMFAGAFAGLWIGMIIGGNLFTNVELFGMFGYELFGTIGALVGAILGLTGGLMLKRGNNSIQP
jgi:hypothetical protein